MISASVAEIDPQLIGYPQLRVPLDITRLVQYINIYIYTYIYVYIYVYIYMYIYIARLVLWRTILYAHFRQQSH